MPENRAHQAKRDNRHNHNRACPTRKYPNQHDINPPKTEDKPRAHVIEKLGFLLLKPRHLPIDLIARGNIGKDRPNKPICDLLRPRRIVLGYIARHIDKPYAVLPPHRRKPCAARHANNIGKRHIGPLRRAHHATLKEIRAFLACRKLDPNVRTARTNRIGRRLNPIKPMPQHPPKRINRKAQRPPLSRKLKNKFLFVIGKVILNRGHFRVNRQRRLKRLGRLLERRCLRPVKSHVKRIAPRPRPPAAETHRIGKWMTPHLLL